MGIGATIEAALLSLAIDLSMALFGLLALVTLVTGMAILTNVGGQGIQKVMRGYIMNAFFGTLFAGGFQVIARGLQGTLSIGG
jgi:hypothetical protein